jgi:hypothetical protein
MKDAVLHKLATTALEAEAGEEQVLLVADETAAE